MGERLKLSGDHPLPGVIIQQLRQRKTEVLLELGAAQHWSQQAEEIQARFEELAGILEFDQGCDRTTAEELARVCLAQELHLLRVGEPKW